jgi:hypothetical protein
MWMANVLFNSATGAAGVAATNFAAPVSAGWVAEALDAAIGAAKA